MPKRSVATCPTLSEHLVHAAKRQKKEDKLQRQSTINTWKNAILLRLQATEEQRAQFNRAITNPRFREHVRQLSAVGKTCFRRACDYDFVFGRDRDRLHHIVRDRLIPLFAEQLGDVGRPDWLNMMLRAMPLIYVHDTIQQVLKNMTRYVELSSSTLPCAEALQQLVQQFAKPSKKQALKLVLEATMQKTAQEVVDDCFWFLLRETDKWSPAPKPTKRQTVRSRTQPVYKALKIWVGDAATAFHRPYSSSVLVHVTLSPTLGVKVRINRQADGRSVTYADISAALLQHPTLTAFSDRLQLRSFNSMFKTRGMCPNDLTLFTVGPYDTFRVCGVLHLDRVPRTGLSDFHINIRIYTHDNVILAPHHVNSEFTTQNILTECANISHADVVAMLRREMLRKLRMRSIRMTERYANNSVTIDVTTSTDTEMAILHHLRSRRFVEFVAPHRWNGVLDIYSTSVYDLRGACDECSCHVDRFNMKEYVNSRGPEHMLYIPGAKLFVCTATATAAAAET